MDASALAKAPARTAAPTVDFDILILLSVKRAPFLGRTSSKQFAQRRRFVTFRSPHDFVIGRSNRLDRASTPRENRPGYFVARTGDPDALWKAKSQLMVDP